MTIERRYPWVRRWAILDDPRANRNSQSWDFLASQPRLGAQILPDLASVPCLVLLGEPGMGKSTAVVDERERLRQDGLNVAQYDLKDAGDENRLIRRLFEDNVSFRAFLSGEEEFYLFLDSLDEGRIQLPTLAGILAEEFRERCADEDARRRLRLRIACRSADYPETLTSTLNDLFAAPNVLRCRLLPLEESDIASAAEANGIDPETFLREVADRRAEPLAAVPITLNLLLLLARGGGNLPNQRVDLYENGCLALCEEWSKSRREKGSAKYLGRISSQQRLMVASRLAALSLFCQRLTIGTEPATLWENGDDLALCHPGLFSSGVTT